MNDGLIPYRYAKALYKFALEKDATDKVYDQMCSVISSFEQNSELNKVLANPYVGNEQKSKLLLSAAGDAVEESYKRFVKLILDSKRENFAYQMALSYRDIYRKAHNISQVVVTTAIEFGNDEYVKIKNLVQRAYNDKTLEFSYKIDETIIGGFIVDVDSLRMDASVSNELEQLRLKLLRK